MPETQGHPVIISAFVDAFVDANHAGNLVTWHSHTGIFIFVQNTLIIWFSKRQNTVEAAMFGSEFVALRICKEMIVACDINCECLEYRWKDLRMCFVTIVVS